MLSLRKSASARYRLIEDGDKILIGLSGGKDSLALLELLARRSRILKPKFTVIAVHVGMTNIPVSYTHLTYFGMLLKNSAGDADHNVFPHNGEMCIRDRSYGPRVPQTPLHMPLAQHTLPFFNCKSYLEHPQWDSKRCV